MFHVNEANEGKGTLTVEDGKMTIHISLRIKKYRESLPWYSKRVCRKKVQNF